ncbi:MAG: hypothetical protein GY711_10655 [bacterium]|nr:hypothetical protein [bacterium]
MRVHLVDASPYIFRAWFALPEMLDTEGRPASAVYGFASFVLRYLGEQSPTHLGFAFDESLTTSFRNDIYPEYKAQRELPPQELVDQLAACKEMAAALGSPYYSDERYEADDLIGTLTAQLLADGHEVVVVSSDKDLAQLVEERVELFDFAKDKRYGALEVREKFGVRPDQIADYLGLAGDSVDNIPGVAGVGAKTAVALLAEFGGLEELYADLERVEQLELRGARSVRRKLEEGRESARLSKSLANLACDAPATARIGELEYNGADPERVDALFAKFGFGTLRARIRQWKK